MASDSVGVTYHKLHHFLTEATWSAEKINEHRLQVMNQCRQTKIDRGFSLIVDDSGPRKSGNFTTKVGRQYIGEIGKTDNGNVIVTTHLYDGRKSNLSQLVAGFLKSETEILTNKVQWSIQRGNKIRFELIP